MIEDPRPRESNDTVKQTAGNTTSSASARSSVAKKNSASTTKKSDNKTANAANSPGSGKSSSTESKSATTTTKSRAAAKNSVANASSAGKSGAAEKTGTVKTGRKDSTAKETASASPGATTEKKVAKKTSTKTASTKTASTKTAKADDASSSGTDSSRLALGPKKGDERNNAKGSVKVNVKTKAGDGAANSTKSASPQSRRTKATSAEAGPPSIDEVAAFITSLKSEKRQKSATDINVSDGGSAYTTGSDAQRNNSDRNNPRAGESSRRSTQGGNDRRGRQAEDQRSDQGRDNRGDNRSDTRADRQHGEGDRAGRSQSGGGQDRGSRGNRGTGQNENTDAGMPIHDGAELSGDGAPISRREKRRLEWIEKRRLWREQKKLERMQRRSDNPDQNDTSEGMLPSDSDESLSTSNPPESAVKQQIVVSQQRSANRTNKPVDKPADKRDERVSRGEVVENVGRQRDQQRNDSRQQRQSKPVSTENKQDQGEQTLQETRGDRDSRVQHSSEDNRSGGRGRSDRDSRGRDNRGRGNRSRDDHGQHDQTQEDGGANSGANDHAVERNDPRDGRGAGQAKRSEKGTGRGRVKASPPPSSEDLKVDDAVFAPPPKRYFVYKDITKKPELTDSVARVVERVEQYLTHELLVEDGESILIGVSGGVDSIVLLDILHVLSFEHGYSLSIAHVNHGLRGANAKRDEKFVRSLAQRYDIPCHSTQVQVKDFAKKHSLSEEVAARELRYKFFRQTASTIRAQSCATAHTADDAAETLLMNLFRGTGLSGLAGIPPRRPLVKKTQLIRPLLQLSKEEIIAYATERELEWYEDETNTLTTYTRNKVRHDVLPKLKEDFNPKIIESLNRTATLLRKADGFIESFIDSTYHSVVVEKEDACVIDIHKLEALHEFLQSEIIERCISTLTFGRTVSFASMDRILSLLGKEVGSRENVVNNLIAVRNRSEIVLMYEQHLQEVFLTVYKLGTYAIGKYSLTLEECHRNDVRIGQERMVEFFDYDRLPYRLTLRTWHAGDSLHAIGLNGHVKISDLLTNEKVDHSDRQNKLVLATATEIVWACGIRMSEDFKITNETRRIVRATFSDKG